MMMSSVARVNLLKSRPLLGIIPKPSQTKFHQMFQFQYQNEKNRKVGKIFLGYKMGVMRELQIGEAFRDYRARGIANRSSFMDFKSRQKNYKSGQRDFKSGQKIQIEARGIFNRSRDYKSGHGLQIGAEQSLYALEIISNVWTMKLFYIILRKNFQQT